MKDDPEDWLDQIDTFVPHPPLSTQKTVWVRKETYDRLRAINVVLVAMCENVRADLAMMAHDGIIEYYNFEPLDSAIAEAKGEA